MCVADDEAAVHSVFFVFLGGFLTSFYLLSFFPFILYHVSFSFPLQVRTVSAKALGAMVKGMGESCFDDLLPWLMETLASEQSSVDRSGAAQGGFFSALSSCF